MQTRHKTYLAVPFAWLFVPLCVFQVAVLVVGLALTIASAVLVVLAPFVFNAWMFCIRGLLRVLAHMSEQWTYAEGRCAYPERVIMTRYFKAHEPWDVHPPLLQRTMHRAGNFMKDPWTGKAIVMPLFLSVVGAPFFALSVAVTLIPLAMMFWWLIVLTVPGLEDVNTASGLAFFTTSGFDAATMLSVEFQAIIAVAGLLCLPIALVLLNILALPPAAIALIVLGARGHTPVPSTYNNSRFPVGGDRRYPKAPNVNPYLREPSYSDSYSGSDTESQ